MTSRIYRQIALCIALIFSTSLHAAGDANKSSNGSVSAIDPFVDQIIKQASDYLTSAKSFAVYSNVTTDKFLPSGQQVQFSRSSRALVRRPDRLRAEVISDKGVIRFFYDGKKMSRFDMDKNIYASFKVSGELGKALDYAMDKFQLDAPLADLLAGSLYENFIENTDSAVYVGLNYLDGDYYHHLALSNENVDFQVWISDDEAPLIHKIVITYKHLEGEPQFTAMLSEWDFNPRTPDLVFDFHPPIDADEIQFLPVPSGKKGVKK